MKNFLLISLLFTAVFATSQTPSAIEKNIQDAKAGMRKLDSLNAELKQMQDSTAQAIYFKNNNNALLALVHENKKIKMKSALTNIAIGIGFLAILVIGLLRKPKQKK